MQSFLITLGYGTAALFGVAVVVAWWEHWSRAHRAGPNLSDVPPPTAAPVRVDVDLATLDAPSASEQQQRQQAVDESLAHAARLPGALQGVLAWPETRPMVGPGAAVEPKPRAVAESGSA